MWADLDDTLALDEEVLLAELGSCLQPEASAPSPAELAALGAAVEARFGPAPIVLSRERSRKTIRVTRRAAVMALLLVGGSASAAAASGGLPLPKPVRAVAHSIGLPVDSPALDEAHHHLSRLRAAVDDGDRQKAHAALQHLELALRQVPRDERQRAQAESQSVLAEAADLLAEPPAPPETALRPEPGTPSVADGPNVTSTLRPAPMPTTQATTGTASSPKDEAAATAAALTDPQPAEAAVPSSTEADHATAVGDWQPAGPKDDPEPGEVAAEEESPGADVNAGQGLDVSPDVIAVSAATEDS